jgi:hypothetical protein
MAALVPITAVLAGCGSTSSTVPNTPAAAKAASQQTTSSSQTSSTSAAAPDTSSPASFVVNTGTNGGDAVKIEGWFGPPVPASESNVDQTALSECPAPTDDGRAIVVALDLRATMESSLSGEVEINLGTLPPESLAEYILGFSGGAQCEAAIENPPGIKLGRLQPHQSVYFSMWITFGNAITPNDPQPSEATLRANNWLMEIPHVTVDGESSAFGQAGATGPRIVKCVQSGYTVGEATIAAVDRTPKVVHARMCP